MEETFCSDMISRSLRQGLLDDFRFSENIMNTSFFSTENKEYIDDGKEGDIVKDLCNHVAHTYDVTC